MNQNEEAMIIIEKALMKIDIREGQEMKDRHRKVKVEGEGNPIILRNQDKNRVIQGKGAYC